MAPSKPILPPLQTPKSMTFPSELHDSPLTSGSDPIIKLEGESAPGSATPITPPLAYTEFLKALTPVFTSPTSAGAEFPKFKFEKRRPSPISVPSSAKSTIWSPLDGPKTTGAARPPPTPAVASPQSAKLPSGLRRLLIPQSSVYSPVTDSPHSARTLRSPFSPSDWKIRYIETPRSAGGKSVSVRQVVTRTVTYKRTPLDPPPKGKRRKTNESRDTKSSDSQSL
ncbi:uncharacterized protein PFLUO_LOCUS7869 [Penicillium psychrofluorescens]|uniref:uncharacterized protein n=1 Tax=Penicillium psychrofluorescens TaxID=3158075 RepID=UPI003CCD615F